MPFVYILYSPDLNIYYVGSCLKLKERLNDHKEKTFVDAYTCRADDWELFLSFEHKHARKIEMHIKRMKSKIYIQNLNRYPEMIDKLLKKFN
jgi:putative endonuclease